VDEDVLAAIIADNEAEPLLRIEEFDDALAFSDDLWRHSAATAATAAAEATAAAAAAAVTAAAAAITATAAAAAAAAESATVTIAAAASAAAAVAATFLEPYRIAEFLFAEETIALVPTASAAVSFAPSIETHACSNFRMPH
jgi:hypothetical protein